MTNRRGALPRLHVVTDDAVVASSEFARRLQEVAAAGGARVALHLRHRGSGAALTRLAETFAQAAARHGATFLVNGRVDVALAAGAQGVHLGRGAMPVVDARRLLPVSAWVGVSLHAADEVASIGEALSGNRPGGSPDGGPDYAFLGPVFPTATHPGVAGLGPEALTRAARDSPVPILGIGGVDSSRAAACRQAGAWGVAVVRSVWAAERPGRAVETLLATMEAEA